MDSIIQDTNNFVLIVASLALILGFIDRVKRKPKVESPSTEMETPENTDIATELVQNTTTTDTSTQVGALDKLILLSQSKLANGTPSDDIPESWLTLLSIGSWLISLLLIGGITYYIWFKF